ncbi:family 10 glycosylhydrolase [Lacimicrobium sp. SS2-24]|uniref:glycoside hydrolase family 10 protein n=1 Tax=Lacimicrobium sp. SS2-24 TaxID=2005569 RepID=UPI000B4BABED|nr:family 10 glycosylhydrolase [Lacimicrobium sp. SS2-24]
MHIKSLFLLCIRRCVSLTLKERLYLLAMAVLVLVLLNYKALFGPTLPNYGKANRESVATEFRAAWVASVVNINWPSEPGLSPQEQQQEALALLDSMASANLNAVILQVRPHADALYRSELEPWSYYLTGEQGQPPEPFYDPLSFWIEQAHNRGMELHAWVNPYRAHHFEGGEISAHSIIRTRPELVRELKNGMYWMNPTQAETVAHSLAVIEDIVSRYDIDGIHYDDYFYPYPSYNDGEDFPDQQAYDEYLAQGGELPLSDWRRQAVNHFVKTLYQRVKAIKSYVKVGISPFGIWRPNFPQTIDGFDQHEKLYADARLWLNQGWLDYFTPQLYWNTNQVAQSFPMLLAWWQQQNHQGRHLWPGLNSNKVTTIEGIDEVVNQIMFSRALLNEQAGQVFWNVRTVTDSPRFHEVLTHNIYANQALVPPSPWLDDTPPEPPVVNTQMKEEVHISWQPTGAEAVFRWVLYYKLDDTWQYRILNHQTRSYTFSPGVLPAEIAVVAVDRTGMQSERINHNLIAPTDEH